IGIRVNRAKKSGMVNITSSVNSRERSGINTILHELNPLFTINVTMRDIKSKDRKSGSAGMPRPISYAVFCLKKKNENKHDKLSTSSPLLSSYLFNHTATNDIYTLSLHDALPIYWYQG